LVGEHDWLLARLTERPNLTVQVLALKLKDRGHGSVSHNTVPQPLTAEGSERYAN